MSEEKVRLKNIGLSPDVHKQLKLLCAEQGWSMTEAVEYLMEKMKNDGNGSNKQADKAGRKSRDQPGKPD